MTPTDTMTDAIAAFDWAATPLGPRSGWPAELRTTVALCLGATYPTAVYWGDNWCVIYNDAFRAVLGENAPVLGQPAEVIWGKWWPDMQKAFAAVAATGNGITETNRKFTLHASKTPRETYWNYNFSPVSDDSGRVVGIFADTRETTEDVLRARADALVVALDDQLIAAPSIDGMIEAALGVIGERLNAQRSGFAEIDTRTATLDIKRCWTPGTLPDISGQYPLGTFGRISEELASGRAVTIADNRTDPRTADPETVERYDRIGLRSGIVVPILDRGTYVGSIFVQDAEPRQWLPHEVALAEVATRRLWLALVRSRAEIALRESEQRYRLIFEQADDIIFTADIQQRITDCNAAGAAAIGLPREAIIGQSIADFVTPDDFRQTTQMLQHKIDQGGNTRHEVGVTGSDGRQMRWENNSTLIVDRDGHPIGLLSISRDVTERRAFDERRELLIHELNHRVKNTLALVQAIAHQSFPAGTTDAGPRDEFIARLRTLASAHDLLTREHWEGVTLAELARAATASFNSGAGRIVIAGPALSLCPKAAVALAMALHELGTNAAKYGALSDDRGHVDLTWNLTDDGFAIEWNECKGPPVTPPSRRGFGIRMIDRVLASDLDGKVEMMFAPEGLRCRIEAPNKGNIA